MSRVKNILKTAAVLFGISILAIGCERDKLINDDPVPAPPQGIYSVTGDGRVTLYWNGPYESDITHYLVYRSLSATTGYVSVGNVPAENNPNLDLIIYQFIDNGVVNGVTYYYAIASVDEAGQNSELSAENVYDTPRPEGEVLLLDANLAPSYSGFSMSKDSVVSWSSAFADVWVDTVDGIFFLNKGRVGTDFQDMGYRDSLDGVSYAPDAGWANLDFMEVVDGHTYVIWTADLHYAKLHVETIGSGHVIFSWAYQTDIDNPELAVPRDDHASSMSAGTLNTSKDAKREYLRSRQTTNIQSSNR